VKSDINRGAAISGLALLPTLGQTLFPAGAQAQGSQHLYAGALRRGEEGWLDRHQHEERLEAHLRL